MKLVFACIAVVMALSTFGIGPVDSVSMDHGKMDTSQNAGCEHGHCAPVQEDDGCLQHCWSIAVSDLATPGVMTNMVVFALVLLIFTFSVFDRGNYRLLPVRNDQRHRHLFTTQRRE